jgi:hypothetical protein
MSQYVASMGGMKVIGLSGKSKMPEVYKLMKRGNITFKWTQNNNQQLTILRRWYNGDLLLLYYAIAAPADLAPIQTNIS